MATEVSTNAAPGKVSYATSKANPEQQAMPRAIALPLLAPVTNFIADTIFSWWPATYELSFDLRGYPPEIIVATLIFNFLVIALLAPIAEEIYFRGYLIQFSVIFSNVTLSR